MFGVFLLCGCEDNASYTAESLAIHNKTPPIAVSEYFYPYEENSKNLLKSTVEFNGVTREYWTYLPKNARDPNMPVVVLLHGSARSGISLAEKWKALSDRYGFFIISPTADGNDWRNYKQEIKFIDFVYIHAVSEFNIKPSDTFLFGHSSGANFALHIAVFHDHIFDSIAVHAGVFPYKDKGLIRKAYKRVPIIIINGTEDLIFPEDAVRETGHAFAKHGFSTVLFLLNNHTHWYYTLAPFINEIAWKHF